MISVSARKLRWLWNRLRYMSAAELLFRIRVLTRAEMEAKGLLLADEVPRPKGNKLGISWLQARPQVESSAYLREADRILSGQFDVFSFQGIQLGNPPQWNRDPRSGKLAPTGLGQAWDYRISGASDDIKYLWEPSRHQHLVTLAQAWALTGKQKYLLGLEIHIRSWLDQCPYMQGVHWRSALEIAIRLINWSAVWHLIGGDESPVFAGRKGSQLHADWLASIFQHAHYISTHYSRYSSANHHLIGQAAGLFIAAVTWPRWALFEKWRTDAQNILEAQALLQTWPDGVNREQSTACQQFVFDLLYVSQLAGAVSGYPFKPGVEQTLIGMAEFVASIMDVAGHVPMIGDADDSRVLRLSCEKDFCNFRAILNTAALSFDRPDLAAKTAGMDDQTRWLCQPPESVRHSSPTRAAPQVRPFLRTSFPFGGYWVLGESFDEAREVRIVADAGPLGYLSIAAHGHADALAITLSVCGEEFLVDPGTYTFHPGTKWRTYFRGTSAHNTVRIDGLDQSVSGGNFMWLRKASACVLAWQDQRHWVAEHDGYQRLQDAVTHRRTLHYDPQHCELLVRDEISCTATHDVEVYWHFAEEILLETVTTASTFAGTGRQTCWKAYGKQAYLELRSLDENVGYDLINGDDALPAGWVSRGFNSRTPAATLRHRSRIQGTRVIETRFLIHRVAP